MEMANKLRLPAAKQPGYMTKDGKTFIFMERVPGFRWESRKFKSLQMRLTETEVETMEISIGSAVESLQKAYQTVGITRK